AGVRRPGGRGMPAAAGPAGGRPAAGGGAVETRRLHQRRDRGEARLRRAHRGAPAAADPQELGESGVPVSEILEPTGDSLSLSAERRLDGVCLRFEAAWQAGRRPDIESLLNDVPPGDRPALLRELIALDLVYRRRGG